LLSKQIKNDYFNHIIFISMIIFFIFTVYVFIAIDASLDIVIVLIMFIVILLGLTAFFSLSFIKLSFKYQHQSVKVISNTIKEIEIEFINALSFGKDANVFHQSRYQKEERFSIQSYNFTYARIQDQNHVSYIVLTKDIEIIHD